ncbi:hypothetical protein KJ966_07850 [bacterium]|nr:hypothetical protein [bacterium]
MRPGTIFLSSFHQLPNDQQERELLVVLNDGRQHPYITVTTTSQPHEKRGNQYGCQLNDELPSFFLPLHSTYLKEETWIRFDTIAELSPTKLKKLYEQGELEKVCNLPKKILEKLLVCAISCRQITENQKNELWRILSKIEDYFQDNNLID